MIVNDMGSKPDCERCVHSVSRLRSGITAAPTITDAYEYKCAYPFVMNSQYMSLADLQERALCGACPLFPNCGKKRIT